MNADTDLSHGPNVVSQPADSRVRHILGTRQVWKVRASQTAGTLVCIEIAVPPGARIPLHRHTNEDETFFVAAGEVVFTGDDCDDGPVTLVTGAVFFAPRGRLHGFHNESAQLAYLLSVVTPGTSTDALYSELAEMAAEQDGPVDRAQVIEVSARHGIDFPHG